MHGVRQLPRSPPYPLPGRRRGSAGLQGVGGGVRLQASPCITGSEAVEESGRRRGGGNGGMGDDSTVLTATCP